jgi:hypothetical protein
MSRFLFMGFWRIVLFTERGQDVFMGMGLSLCIQMPKGTQSGPFAPIVDDHPASKSAATGATVTFTSLARGNPTPTVQWQVNSGSGWTNLSNGGNYSGVTTSTLTITGITTAIQQYQYRAVWTNSGGSANSEPATLLVDQLFNAAGLPLFNAAGLPIFKQYAVVPAGAMRWDDSSLMIWSDSTDMIWSGP